MPSPEPTVVLPLVRPGEPSPRLILKEEGGAVQILTQHPGQVIPEPAGSPKRFKNPLSAEELEELRWYLEDYLSESYAVYEERGLRIGAQLVGWGERLFESVFGVGHVGLAAYQQMQMLPDWELWLSSSSSAFLALPWELIKDPAQPTPLALAGGAHRFLPGRAAVTRPQPDERLRVLMVIARPKALGDVSYRSIARPLLARLAANPSRGQVDLEVLRPPTFDALRLRLERARTEGRPFHVVHFDGHGYFREAAGSGNGFVAVVEFESEAGRGEVVTADPVTALLNESETSLYVFNACRSSMLTAGARPDSGLATRFLLDGAGAVVAMGYTVQVKAAAEFVATFYERLSTGERVAAAVTQGRRQLLRRPLRPSARGELPLADWVIPLHYARRDVAFPQLQPVFTKKTVPEDAVLAHEERTRPESRSVGEEPESAFFGRDAEIFQLERSLRQRRVVVVHGPGGIGKTELAREFAQWLRDSQGLDPEGFAVCSFTSGSASFRLDDVLLGAGLRLLGPELALLAPEDRRATMLAALRDRGLLLIWDNFESVFSLHDPAGGTPVLSDEEREEYRRFLARVAGPGRGGVIITSRNPETWLGDDLHRIPLGGLRWDEVLELADSLLCGLLKAHQRRRQRAFSDLLRALDGNPFCLRVVLPRLEYEEPDDILAELRGDCAIQPKSGASDLLRACVLASFRHLAAEHAGRLPALALCEGVVDSRVLAALSLDAGAPPRFQGIDQAAWETSLDRCTEVGLLTRARKFLWRIHPVLPRFLMEIWSEQAGAAFAGEQTACRSAFVRAQARVADPPGSWREDLDRMADLEVAYQAVGAAAGAALDTGADGEALQILKALVRFCNHRGWIHEARVWLTRARETAEQGAGLPPALGTDRGELWYFAVLSQAAQMLREGKPAPARAALEAILSRLPRGAGSLLDRAHRASVFLHLGRAAQAEGRLSEARRFFRRSLQEKERLDDWRGVASLAVRFGTLEEEARRGAAARRWYEKALEIHRDKDDRPGLIYPQIHLGGLALEAQRLDEAQEWFERALRIALEVSNGALEARCRRELGAISRLRGDFLGAKRRLLRALEIEEQLGNGPGRGLVYRQLGLLEEARGNEQEALDWLVVALALHPHVGRQGAATLRDLARLTARQGLSTLAARWQEKRGGPLPVDVKTTIETFVAQATPPSGDTDDASSTAVSRPHRARRADLGAAGAGPSRPGRRSAGRGRSGRGPERP